MTTINQLYSRLINAMGVEDLEIPMTAVKFYKKEDEIPELVKENQPTISLTSCQAAKQAGLGDAALLTYDNIGCVAAAITFGIVDKDQTEPLGDSKVYTDIMRDQSGLGDDFKPPSPKDFTEGNVYACKDSGHMDFALFGNEDTGRFKDVETAKKAMKDMMAIQPPTTKGVFLYSRDFDEIDIIPDVKNFRYNFDGQAYGYPELYVQLL